MNTAIKEYFEPLEDVERRSENDRLKLRRLRGRIRAFSWSYESCFGGGARFCQDKDGFNRTKNEYFLAMANENNEIIFARICFSHEHFPTSSSGEWSAQITGHTKVHSEDGVGMKFSSSLPNRPDRFINKLSWSPWYRTKCGQNEAFVAYSTRGKLNIRKVSVTVTESQSTNRADQGDFEFRIGDRDWNVASALSERYRFGPLLWYEKVRISPMVKALISSGRKQSRKSNPANGLRLD